MAEQFSLFPLLGFKLVLQPSEEGDRSQRQQGISTPFDFELALLSLSLGNLGLHFKQFTFGLLAFLALCLLLLSQQAGKLRLAGDLGLEDLHNVTHSMTISDLNAMVSPNNVMCCLVERGRDRPLATTSLALRKLLHLQLRLAEFRPRLALEAGSAWPKTVWCC